MYGAKNQATQPTTAEAGEEVDPYGIVPDGFCEAWGEDTIPAALKAAERAESTTPRDDRQRCPACASLQVSPKTDHFSASHKVNTQYRCSNCWHHFDDPA